MFKITFIRTLSQPSFAEDNLDLSRKKEARYRSVMRIVKPNTEYRFQKLELPENFYGKGFPKLSVSAIVGENGQGKSSLMELMLRIINNMAMALRPAFREVNRSHPRYVRGVHAEMGFEIDEIAYIARVEDTIVECDRNGEGLWRYDYLCRKDENCGLSYLNPNCKEAREKKNPATLTHDWLSSLFYTIVINYSAYSYNPTDYFPELIDSRDVDEDEQADALLSEESCWLTGIFHKNDGYQMPVVLNPYRDAGQINYSNEMDLLQTRIFLLAMAEDSPLRSLFQNKQPKSFVFDIVTDYSPTRNGRFTSAMVKLYMQYLHYIQDWRTVKSEVVDLLGIRIISVWSKCVGLDLMTCCRSKDEGDKRRTLNYIVYKTLKIALNYAKYKGYKEAVIDVKHPLDGKSPLEEYIKKLYSEQSHITLKLMRAIAWLVFAHYSTSMLTDWRKIEEGVTNSEIPIQKFSYRISKCIREVANYTTEGHGNKLVEKYADLPVHQWTQEELLPAPSFNVDMAFDKLDEEGRPTGAIVRLNSFSSGEKHIISSLCTALYHIYNLRTLWDMNNQDEKSIRYKYVNLVFDEIELYFHPKYQTMFMQTLISTIRSMNLAGKIEGINIMVSTHSPFILSDIPKESILCMSDGKPEPWKGEGNTFCANVYDILSTGFFMDKFVGDFAENKYHELIDRIERADSSKQQELMDIRQQVSLIGDDYLRTCLMAALSNKFSDNTLLENERKILLARLAEIDNKLNQ